MLNTFFNQDVLWGKNKYKFVIAFLFGLEKYMKNRETSK